MLVVCAKVTTTLRASAEIMELETLAVEFTEPYGIF